VEITAKDNPPDAGVIERDGALPHPDIPRARRPIVGRSVRDLAAPSLIDPSDIEHLTTVRIFLPAEENTVKGVVRERSAFVKLRYSMGCPNNTESQELCHHTAGHVPVIHEEEQRGGTMTIRHFARGVEIHFVE
jgi:hypothetical protein